MSSTDRIPTDSGDVNGVPDKPLPFAGRYRTILLVVDEDAADGILDTLCHHDGRLFAISSEGVTAEAFAEGADPQSWDWEEAEDEELEDALPVDFTPAELRYDNNEGRDQTD